MFKRLVKLTPRQCVCVCVCLREREREIPELLSLFDQALEILANNTKCLRTFPQIQRSKHHKTSSSWAEVKHIIRDQFHHHFTSSFYAHRSQKCKKRQSSHAAFCAFGTCAHKTCWWNWPQEPILLKKCCLKTDWNSLTLHYSNLDHGNIT